MDRTGIFAGDDPFALARAWLAEAEAAEINDPNAIALATVDQDGMPHVRMVLLYDIEDAAFVFFTKYRPQTAQEAEGAGNAALVRHWEARRGAPYPSPAQPPAWCSWTRAPARKAPDAVAAHP